MKTPAALIGFVILGVGTITSGAIASDLPPATRSMADLNLPVLTTEVRAPEVVAPQLSDVLPAGEFSDVSPTHWAYSAVNSLAENYGCLAGYPDGTFRGEQFVTRYEFAAAMDVCLGNVLQLTESESHSDLDTLLEDLADLESELGTLSDDIDAIEPD